MGIHRKSNLYSLIVSPKEANIVQDLIERDEEKDKAISWIFLEEKTLYRKALILLKRKTIMKKRKAKSGKKKENKNDSNNNVRSMKNIYIHTFIFFKKKKKIK